MCRPLPKLLCRHRRHNPSARPASSKALRLGIVLKDRRRMPRRRMVRAVRIPVMDSEDRKVTAAVLGDVMRNVVRVRRRVEMAHEAAVRWIPYNSSKP